MCFAGRERVSECEREGGGPFYDVFLQLEGMCLVFFFLLCCVIMC